MNIFENFTNTLNSIFNDDWKKGWVKWVHPQIPDKPGKYRVEAIQDARENGHGGRCTILSGCFFAGNNMPKYYGLPGLNFLHPKCHCTIKTILNPKENVKVTCPIQKFTEYIFGEKGQANGKQQLFHLHGFTIEDSEMLQTEYENQAKEKYANGNYEIGFLDEYGQRITIAINITNKEGNTYTYKGGYMVEPLGHIKLTTPLGGR